jgi:hypothetical protein
MKDGKTFCSSACAAGGGCDHTTCDCGAGTRK